MSHVICSSGLNHPMKIFSGNNSYLYILMSNSVPLHRHHRDLQEINISEKIVEANLAFFISGSNRKAARSCGNYRKQQYQLLEIVEGEVNWKKLLLSRKYQGGAGGSDSQDHTGLMLLPSSRVKRKASGWLIRKYEQCMCRHICLTIFSILYSLKADRKINPQLTTAE